MKDERSDRLAAWLCVLEERQRRHGELRPSSWNSLVNGLIGAIADGRRTWPVYARFKFDVEPQRVIEVVIRDVAASAQHLPPWVRGSTNPIKLAMDRGYREIEERLASGDLASTPENVQLIADWKARQ